METREEATAIATDFVYSLENVPQEVHHLLAEMRIKEDKAHTIHNEIQSKTQRYIRHTLKQQPLSKDINLKHIDQQYAEIDRLSRQKIALAERIVHIIGRACGRLEADITRAVAAGGESQDATVSNTMATPSVFAAGSWMQARNASERLKDALKAEIAPSPVNSPSPQPTISSSGGPLKKRRLNPPISANTPTPSGPSVPRANRITFQRSRSSRRSQSVLGGDPDADGEADEDSSKEFGDPDDTTLYCYCRKMSYGEMVGCDNDDCPYEWFHLSCTGIKGPLPDSWYCSDCAPKFQFGGPSEKHRKSHGRRKGF